MNARSPYFFDSLAPDLAQTAANAGSILAKCTVYPWLVTVTYRTPEGVTRLDRQVIEALMSEAPDPLAFVPDGCEFMRADVFPATRFDDMNDAGRARYRPEYRAYLMWRKAKALGKAVGELVPWVDVDPVLIDENAERWVKPVGRYCGE